MDATDAGRTRLGWSPRRNVAGSGGSAGSGVSRRRRRRSAASASVAGDRRLAGESVVAVQRVVGRQTTAAVPEVRRRRARGDPDRPSQLMKSKDPPPPWRPALHGAGIWRNSCAAGPARRLRPSWYTPLPRVTGVAAAGAGGTSTMRSRSHGSQPAKPGRRPPGAAPSSKKGRAPVGAAAALARRQRSGGALRMRATGQREQAQTPAGPPCARLPGAAAFSSAIDGKIARPAASSSRVTTSQPAASPVHPAAVPPKAPQRYAESRMIQRRIEIEHRPQGKGALMESRAGTIQLRAKISEPPRHGRPAAADRDRGFAPIAHARIADAARIPLYRRQLVQKRQRLHIGRQPQRGVR